MLIFTQFVQHLEKRTEGELTRRQIHWPTSWSKEKDESGNNIKNGVTLSATWAAMEALVLAGKARSIGVSNFFTQEELEEVLPKQVIQYTLYSI